KTTAVTANHDNQHDPSMYVAGLCAKAEEMLADWPTAQNGWRDFMHTDMQPALDLHLQFNAS
ncbi:MAG: hypothetical protein ACO398_10740, partial [Kiritimatiellia bacterium]